MAGTEAYFVGTDTRIQSYGMTEPGADESALLLVKAFPWFRHEDYFSISTPAYHDVIGEQIITCNLPMQATHALIGAEYVGAGRKFCIESKTSFLKAYKLFTGNRPDWLPASANVMFVAENHQEYGKPYPGLADTFYDIYFSGDPAEIEKTFWLPERRGAYETYYGITVKDGQPARIKQYVYDDQGGFSDWDVIYMMHAKRAGIWPPSN